MALAYYGLNCNEWPIYLVSISQNTAEQIKLAEQRNIIQALQILKSSNYPDQINP